MIWYYILTFLSQIVESFAGFGSSALAAPFLSLAIGTAPAVTLLCLNCYTCNTFLFLAFDRKRVNWKAYKRLVLTVLPFLPLGLFAYSYLKDQENILKLILGIVILFVGARNCYYAFIKKEAPQKLSKLARTAALVSGAIITGLFSTGGPLLTLYVADEIDDKDRFRATMNAFWFTITGTLILCRAILFQLYTAEILLTYLKAVPCIALGMCVGMYLHKRVDNKGFTKVIYLVLLFGGLLSTLFSLYNMMHG